MPELIVKAGGKKLSGWKSATITRSLEALAGAFTLGIGGTAMGLAPDEFVGVHLAEEGDAGAAPAVIHGYVDEVSASVSAEHSGVRVRGRDVTATLVDCSALNTPGEWANVSLGRLALILAAPFEVRTRALADTGPRLARFALEQGETAHAALERACRMRGVLMRTSPDGYMELITPPVDTFGAPRPQLSDTDGTVIAYSVRRSTKERYGKYIVRGQRTGSDLVFGEDTIAAEGSAVDSTVRAARRIVLLPEGVSTPDDAQRRAEWEATARAARGTRVQVTVASWLTADGRLWQPGELVDVALGALGLRESMLIASTEFRLDESGWTCALELSRADAWQPQPSLPTESEPAFDLFGGTA